MAYAGFVAAIITLFSDWSGDLEHELLLRLFHDVQHIDKSVARTKEEPVDDNWLACITRLPILQNVFSYSWWK